MKNNSAGCEGIEPKRKPFIPSEDIILCKSSSVRFFCIITSRMAETGIKAKTKTSPQPFTSSVQPRKPFKSYTQTFRVHIICGTQQHNPTLQPYTSNSQIERFSATIPTVSFGQLLRTAYPPQSPLIRFTNRLSAARGHGLAIMLL